MMMMMLLLLICCVAQEIYRLYLCDLEMQQLSRYHTSKKRRREPNRWLFVES